MSDFTLMRNEEKRQQDGVKPKCLTSLKNASFDNETFLGQRSQS